MSQQHPGPQDWQQPQIYQPQDYPPGAVQPYAPQRQVAPKSTAAGLVLGLVIPGAGCMYAGRPGPGILILVLWLLSVPLAFVWGIGIATGFLLWVLSAVFGYTMTRRWNADHGIVS